VNPGFLLETSVVGIERVTTDIARSLMGCVPDKTSSSPPILTIFATIQLYESSLLELIRLSVLTSLFTVLWLKKLNQS
jgi:hypothetical protein